MAGAKISENASGAWPEAQAKFASVSSKDGELGRLGADPVVADLNAQSFSEGVRTPLGVVDTKTN